MEKTVSATSQVWRERIAAQQAGGQSIRALCKENGWHEHAFYWWRSRLGLSPASMSDERVAALVCLIEGRGSILGGGRDSK